MAASNCARVNVAAPVADAAAVAAACNFRLRDILDRRKRGLVDTVDTVKTMLRCDLKGPKHKRMLFVLRER
jgi:hypothetical protein